MDIDGIRDVDVNVSGVCFADFYLAYVVFRFVCGSVEGFYADYAVYGVCVRYVLDP